jgi:hypothetical protein
VVREVGTHLQVTSASFSLLLAVTFWHPTVTSRELTEGMQETRMIERRHIDHAQLLQLGKMLLLLVKRQELPLDPPPTSYLNKETMPLEELRRAS